MKFLCLCLIFFSNTFALSTEDTKGQTLHRKVKILSYRKEIQSKYYLVVMTEHAATYRTLPELIPCLKRSLEKNKVVAIELNPKTLTIVKCW